MRRKDSASDSLDNSDADGPIDPAESKPLDEILAALLAAGRTHAAAAACAGCGDATVWRRWRDPVFRRRVAELRDETVSRGLGRLSDLLSQAAETLGALLTSETDWVRLAASKAIFELTIKLKETVELEKRIGELEARAEGRSNNLRMVE